MSKNEHSHEEEEGCSLREIIFAGLLFIVGLILPRLPFEFLGWKSAFFGFDVEIQQVLCTFLFLAAYLICGRNVVVGAISNMVKGRVFDEQFLMTVASLGAVFWGEMPEAVAVMLFYQVGEFFQDYAVDKSRDDINALMEICPDTANVLRDGKEVSVNATDVQVGEIVVVKPGERIPVDGIITRGKTFLDNSALTGESVPVEVFEGSEVFSGAINKNAVIEIKAVKIARESSATRILRLVEEASAKKARTEKFITRFSKVYTPIVCALALFTAIVVPFSLKYIAPNVYEVYGFKVWIYRALMFLVVSCPCAIVISVPLSFFGGIGAASKRGILVKGSGAIETLSKVRTAVFDKTGTLTKGVFVVTDIHSVNSEKFPEDELIAIAAHAETYSNHPAAKSIKNAHHGECCSLVKIANAEEISGQGIKVNLNGKSVLAGNEHLMKSNGVVGFKECERGDFGTVVYIAIEGEYAGHIVISDQTKDDAVLAVNLLHKAGVQKIVMLSGDNERTTAKIANETGVDEYYANLLPEDKVHKMEELIAEQKNGGTVAFAGDGINDAPVLARSDVGIAMGALGSDAAIESADVVIMNDEPSKISSAIHISRKTISIAKQNIVFSLVVKVLIMAFGAAGIANMWLAVFGDVGVTFLAVLNAMRMLKGKRN